MLRTEGVVASNHASTRARLTVLTETDVDTRHVRLLLQVPPTVPE